MSLDYTLVDEDAESFVDDIDLIFGSVIFALEQKLYMCTLMSAMAYADYLFALEQKLYVCTLL